MPIVEGVKKKCLSVGEFVVNRVMLCVSVCWLVFKVKTEF